MPTGKKSSPIGTWTLWSSAPGLTCIVRSRWRPAPIRVQAQVHAHISSRIDPQSGVRRQVGTPDSVQVLAVLADGARASYHLSGAATFGQAMGIQLYGTEGALLYDLLHDRI